MVIRTWSAPCPPPANQPERWIAALSPPPAEVKAGSCPGHGEVTVKVMAHPSTPGGEASGFRAARPCRQLIHLYLEKLRSSSFLLSTSMSYLPYDTPHFL